MAHEHAPKTQEHHKSPEGQTSKGEEHEKLQQTVEAGKQAKHEAHDSLETIRSSIEKEAAKTESTKHKHEAESGDRGPGQVIIDRSIKQKAYTKELHRVRSHLPKTQRSFSRFIHSRGVEAVSEVSGKTVARPSGLLGGGIAAFVGTTALVLVSRHYGFSYNFFVFIALLVAGFFVGLIIELLVRSVIKAKS